MRFLGSLHAVEVSPVRGISRFLGVIDASLPPELDVHLILKNSAIHKTVSIRCWLAWRSPQRKGA